MIHGILQFTPTIAFRYVLHRDGSQDIRCRESFLLEGKGALLPPLILWRDVPLSFNQ